MKISILLFSIILFSAFAPKDEIHIWFPKNAGTSQTCVGNEAEFSIDISTYSKENIPVFGLSTDKNNLKIYHNGKLVTHSDTLLLTKDVGLLLKIKGHITATGGDSFFRFKTNLPEYLNNTISLHYGRFWIENEQVREGKEQSINVSESCQDSIKVFFPVGGTITGVRLYSDSGNTNNVVRSVSYRCCSPSDNYLDFSKADIGRYWVQFSSCHWGNAFWLNVK